MTAMSGFEEKYSRMLASLHVSPEMNVLVRTQGEIDETYGNSAEIFEKIAAWLGISLDPSLQRCLIRFNEVAAHWHIDQSPTELTGEFNLPFLLVALAHPSPHLGWDGMPETERQLVSEFKVIDSTPDSGVGHLTSLRIQECVTIPEVWFLDSTRGTYKLDVCYCQYMEALLLTKGTYGWQYLFADVSLGATEFEAVENSMKQMLRLFPSLFPDFDYEPLRVRLAERLR
ncbi:hypothetical protein [Streptomyces sp. NPDC059142]|uniref:hypothetical protein n=1 Tax=Streptomyces sp. NPDC059142 TaxID=3346739 RepID=UPI0036A783BF